LSADRDAFVAERFDECQARFKAEVAASDVRLRAVVGALGPLEGRRILDLGCGKGRFAAHLRKAGASVVGLDGSAAMLAAAPGLDRVRGSARRLPFAAGTFDGVVAIEVLEHVGEIGPVLAEIGRVLKPGGRLAIVDKNAGALGAKRPYLPALAIKRLDEHRGLWMYPSDGPVRERWFWPGRLSRRLARDFDEVRVDYLLRPEESGHWVFRAIPAARLMTLWSAVAPGGSGWSPKPPLSSNQARSWSTR
jgi:2-polyprenyl-6-hydroxyphenyl methylase/3-demethylubiquinone-9 3-methyltransferase